MICKSSDEWETPQQLFDELNCEFTFDIDVCSNGFNSKCKKYMIDCLKYHEHWNIEGDVCFMNPPYSKPYPFIKRAYEESLYAKIVCLLKCDPSTQWWAIFWDHKKNTPKPGVEVRFLSKRLKFERNGISHGTANFPSAIVIMDRRYAR